MSAQKPGGMTKLKDKFNGSLRALKKKPSSARKSSVEKQPTPAAKNSKSKEGGRKKNSMRKSLAGKFKKMVTVKTKKKRNSKDEDASSSSSSSKEETRSMPEVGEENNPFATKKKELPGDVKDVVHVENFLRELIKAERPDIGSCELSELEAAILDEHMRGRTELVVGDCIYMEDNLDDDERDYVRYEIGAKYAEGRYSSIYLATRTRCIKNVATPDSECYLIKVALRKNGSRSAERLKNEGQILQDVGNKRLESNKMLFTPVQIDQGKICDLPFLVMNYLEKNLAKFREECGGSFTKPTAVYAAFECLNTMADFHGRNYVHRDIKPANFCGGILDLRQKLFLIDFGDAIKKTDLSPPELGIPDGLTLPYWSLQAHAEGNVSQRGDLESWFYLAIDLIEPEAFNWSHEKTIEASEKKKKQFWKDYKNILKSPKLIEIGDILVQKKEISFPKDHMAVRQKVKEMLDSLTKGKIVVDWVQPAAATPVAKSKIQSIAKKSTRTAPSQTGASASAPAPKKS